MNLRVYGVRNTDYCSYKVTIQQVQEREYMVH